ncbi:MAG: non-canonical purine NTP diphosphatase [Bacteroidota bacterium]
MKMVFATHNPHKLKEVTPLMPKGINLLSLTDIGCFEEIPETGTTLEENACLKALHVLETYGYPCFADDTGLLVDALNGEPGVYSARYAGPGKDADANMDKLLLRLGQNTQRTARFQTVVALSQNREQRLFFGTIEGSITQEKRGASGFGYDPIFMPFGFNRTFAELPLALKNKIGHRGKAIQKLVDYLKS